jgi:hypothetical protein
LSAPSFIFEKKKFKELQKIITWISHTYCLKHHHALKTKQFIFQFISTDQTQLELHHNTNNYGSQIDGM